MEKRAVVVVVRILAVALVAALVSSIFGHGPITSASHDYMFVAVFLAILLSNVFLNRVGKR